MAASEFKAGTFDKSTNTSTPVDQAVTGVGFTPTGLILSCSLETANNSASDHLDISIGFSDGTNDKTVTVNSEDALGTSDCYRIGRSAKIISLRDRTDGSLIAEADLKSFDSDGFTLTWTTNNATAYKINYTAFGGSNLANVEVGSFTQATSNGTQSVSALADGDFLMLLTHQSTTEDSSVAGYVLAMGMATSSTERGCMVVAGQDAVGTTATWRHLRTDRILALRSTSAATNLGDADFVNFTGSGFDLSWANVSGSAPVIYYLLVKGGTWEVGTGKTKNGTGTKAYTTAGEPEGVMQFGVGLSATTTLSTAVTAIDFGASDSGLADHGLSTVELDNVGTTQSISRSSNSHLINLTGSTGIVAEQASISSFNATDFTLNFNIADTAERNFIWAVLEADAGSAVSNPWYHYAQQ